MVSTGCILALVFLPRCPETLASITDLRYLLKKSSLPALQLSTKHIGNSHSSPSSLPEPFASAASDAKLSFCSDVYVHLLISVCDVGYTCTCHGTQHELSVLEEVILYFSQLSCSSEVVSIACSTLCIDRYSAGMEVRWLRWLSNRQFWHHCQRCKLCSPGLSIIQQHCSRLPGRILLCGLVIILWHWGSEMYLSCV